MMRVTRFSRWIALAILAAAPALPPQLNAQAPPEGVKVHGHWVIEVRNADGTLHERREFQNALVSEGAVILNMLLSGQAALTGDPSAGIWAVILRLSASSSAVCGTSSIIDAVCTTEPGHPLTAGHLFKNLTKTADLNTGTFVLKGSVVLASAGTVSQVGTTVTVLLISPAGGGEVRFTSTDLASPIAVQATQSVSVTVTISFS